MSVLVKAGESIFKDPMNTSPSKYQFSFPKAPRFPGSQPKLTEEEIKKNKEKEEKAEKKFKQLEEKVKYKKQDYYLLPTTQSRRYANFGFHPPVDNRSKKLTKSVSVVKDSKSKKKKERKDLINQFAEYDYEKKYFHGVKYSIPSDGKDAEEKKKKKELKKQKRKEKERKKREENYRYKNSIRYKREKEHEDDYDKDSDISPGPGEYDILKKVNEDFGYNSPKIIIRQPSEIKTEIKKKITIRLNSEKKTESKRKLKLMDGKSKTKDDKSKIEDDKPIITDLNVQIRNSGKYFLSQIPNVNSVRMQKTEKEKEYEKLLASNDKNDKKRLKLLEEIKLPGPGDYIAYDKCEIKNKKYTQFPKTLIGNMIESKYRSHGGITFGTNSEIKDSRINYPGPGSYRIPSDFGIYVKKGYEKKYPEENVYPEEKHKVKDRPLRSGTKKEKDKKEENKNKNKKKGDNEDHKNEPEIIKEDKKEDIKENNIDNGDNGDNKDNKDEDKESECKMLKDILSYKDI